MGRRAWIIASSEFVSHRVQLGGVYATACRVGGRLPGTVRLEPTGPGLPPAAASNRACGSPAHGSPTSFTDWHTRSWV
jgi:hypothetical protein